MADSPAEAPTEKAEASESKDSFDQILKKVVRGDAPVRELSPGTLLSDRFRIAHILGAGGMGSVYLARDESLGREVAIKLHHSSGGGFRLKREAVAMARLAHPNVVTVFEVGELDRFPFVVMEYVPGTTLRAWLAEQQRTVAEILDMVLAAGDGLAAAHDAGLIHRDIKPENVLIGRDGRARVGDFGLARELDSKEEPPSDAISGHMGPMTQTGAVLGTPAYMAPEQLRGETIDARIDQFAFCVTVWEALWGQRPFAGKSLPELEEAARTKRLREPPPLPKVSARVRQALERGLSAKPDDRFPSMRELLAALRAVRRRRAAYAAGALSLAAAGAVAFFALRPAAGPTCTDEAELLAPVPLHLPAKLRAQGHTDAAQRVDSALQSFVESLRANARTACEQLAASQPALHRKATTCLQVAARTSGALLAFEPLTAADVPSIVQRSRAALPATVACVSPTFLASSPQIPEDPAELAAFMQARSDLELANTELEEVRADRAQRYIDRVKASPARESPLIKPALLVAQAGAAHLASRHEEAAKLASEGYYAARALDDDVILAEALSVLLAVAADQTVESMTAPGWLRTAVADAERIAPRASWLSASLYVNAADLAVSTDDPKAALQYTARGRALIQPHQSQLMTRLLAIEGDVHMWTGKVTEGKALFERAIQARIDLLGADNPSVGLLMSDYARALLDSGLEVEAVAIAQRAVKILEPLLAEGDHAADTARLTLGAVLLGLDEPDQARKLLETVRSHQTRPGAPRTALLASANMNLGLLALDAQDTQRALPLLEEALAINTQLLGPDRDEVSDVLYNLTVAHKQAGDLTKSLAAIERAAQIRSKRPGTWRHRTALGMVAFIANEKGDHARALSATETALAFPDNPGDPQATALPQLERARALIALKRNAEARPLLMGARARYVHLNMTGRVEQIDRLLAQTR